MAKDSMPLSVSAIRPPGTSLLPNERHWLQFPYERMVHRDVIVVDNIWVKATRIPLQQCTMICVNFSLSKFPKKFPPPLHEDLMIQNYHLSSFYQDHLVFIIQCFDSDWKPCNGIHCTILFANIPQPSRAKQND